MNKLKFLHTADWHLGKRLERFSRFEEQQIALEHLCTIAEEEQVDLVLVAGDVFDHFNPDNAATELFYKTVHRLSRGGTCPVIAIAGNHDSGEYLSASDPLARQNGIFLAGQPFQDFEDTQLGSGIGISSPEAGLLQVAFPDGKLPKVNLIATPYTNEFRLKQALKTENKEAELRDLLQSKWGQLAEKHFENGDINLLMTHLFMVKKGEALPEEPSDEKPILHVGGAQAVYTSCLPTQLHYTALGHLHGFRNIGSESAPVVYASSLMTYSFGESGKTGQAAIVEIGEKCTLRSVAIEGGLPLVRLEASSVENAKIQLSENQDSWVELYLKTESYLNASDRQMLNALHSRLVSIIPILEHEEFEGVSHQVDLSLSRTELFTQYFESKNGQLPNEEILAVFKEIESAP